MVAGEWAGLSDARGGVQEDGTEGGQDLFGLGDGEFPRGFDDRHPVAALQMEDEAGGGGACAGAGAGLAAVGVARGVQSLHAAVGDGERAFHALALLRRQDRADQVTTLLGSREDAWGRRSDTWISNALLTDSFYPQQLTAH